MSELIEHLVDTDAVLDEAAKVLVPGEAVVVDAQSGCLAQQGTPRGRRSARLCRGQPVRHLRPPGHEVVGHLSIFTRRALEQLLVVAGFVDIEITGAPYHVVPGPLRPLDRLLCRTPSRSSILLASAGRPS
jgi:hypothetical protein